MNSVTTSNKRRKLTEKQNLFLKALFTEEAAGNVRTAMNLAGYSKNVAIHEVLDPLKDEIIEATNLFLAAHGPQAAMALLNVMVSPTQIGAQNKRASAADILDRVGVVKKQEPDQKVAPIQNIILLPTKEGENTQKTPEKVIDGEYERVS